MYPLPHSISFSLFSPPPQLSYPSPFLFFSWDASCVYLEFLHLNFTSLNLFCIIYILVSLKHALSSLGISSSSLFFLHLLLTYSSVYWVFRFWCQSYFFSNFGAFLLIFHFSQWLILFLTFIIFFIMITMILYHSISLSELNQNTNPSEVLEGLFDDICWLNCKVVFCCLSWKFWLSFTFVEH